LDLGGKLVELWDDLVKDGAFPSWFDWPEVEAESIELVSYGLSIIHGLIQTPTYATAMLNGRKDSVDGRLTRQKILVREEPPPPDCLFLIDEFALRRQVASKEVMREQLQHLTDGLSDTATVQVVPDGTPHIGVVGSFTLATLEDLTEIAYVETFARGFTLADMEDIAEAHRALNEIRSLALPVTQSAEMIRNISKEMWHE
jgi:hypothetical protein